MRKRSICIFELVMALVAIVMLGTTPRVFEAKWVLSELTLDATSALAITPAYPPPAQTVSGFLVSRVAFSNFFCVYRREGNVTVEVSPGDSVVQQQAREAVLADAVARRVIDHGEAKKLQTEGSSVSRVRFYQHGLLLNIIIAAAVALLASRAAIELLRRKVQ